MLSTVGPRRQLIHRSPRKFSGLAWTALRSFGWSCRLHRTGGLSTSLLTLRWRDDGRGRFPLTLGRSNLRKTSAGLRAATSALGSALVGGGREGGLAATCA